MSRYLGLEDKRYYFLYEKLDQSTIKQVLIDISINNSIIHWFSI